MRIGGIVMLKGSAGRRIERWFFELGAESGSADVPASVVALWENGCPGWVVVESDHMVATRPS
ncbi:hypothetical protein [Amycolatopsis sp. GA6-003]|uniref:hypothetical protein n=1 Tax=Amycolatopsis sp. GA6-003 TaxID=2652444 RepID=UPI0039171849